MARITKGVSRISKGNRGSEKFLLFGDESGFVRANKISSAKRKIKKSFPNAKVTPKRTSVDGRNVTIGFTIKRKRPTMRRRSPTRTTRRNTSSRVRKIGRFSRNLANNIDDVFAGL